MGGGRDGEGRDGVQVRSDTNNGKNVTTSIIFNPPS